MLEEKMRKRKRLYPIKSLKPVLRIYTEGEKTEINYVKSYIQEYLKQKGHIGHDVIIIQPSDFSPYGLLQAARKDKNSMPNDKKWLVFDCDNHPQKANTFEEARHNNINIAYSSICFETWILLHFEYSTRPFKSCTEIKRVLDKYFDNGYDKAGTGIFYQATGDHFQRLRDARENANKLCSDKVKNFPGENIWEMNPYTDIHKLLDAIDDFLKHD